MVIRKEHDALIIVPVHQTWTSYPAGAPTVRDDFLNERPALLDDCGRVVL